MTVSEKKESKTGSKGNLNESTLPLLDEGDNAKASAEGKDGIELETKGENVENSAGASDKKKKKEKKVKEPKEKKERTSPFVAAQNFTVGLNVVDRDDKHINSHVNLAFDDIIAETDASQGFEFIWRLTFLIFTTVRLWLYRLIAGVLALPLALIWAIIFAFINVFVIWFATPAFKVYDVLLFHVHRLYAGLVRTFLDPVFTSFGLLLANIKSTRTTVSSTDVNVV